MSQADQDEYYSAKISKKANICLQLLLVLTLLIYIFMETVSFRTMHDISNNMETIFVYDNPRQGMTIDDIRVRGEIFDWMNVTISRIFTNVPYEKTYPTYLFDDPDDMDEIVPIIPEDQQAGWRRTITRNNYVTGVRINVLQ